MLAREWFTPGELAKMALPEMPDERAIRVMAERAGWRRDHRQGIDWRKRAGSGGGYEYHYSLLPMPAQIKLALELNTIVEADERTAARDKTTRADMWAWFEALAETKKAKAREKLTALDAVRALQ